MSGACGATASQRTSPFVFRRANAGKRKDETSSDRQDAGPLRLLAVPGRESRSDRGTRRYRESSPARLALCAAMDYSIQFPLSVIFAVACLAANSCARDLGPARQLGQVKLRQCIHFGGRQNPDTAHALLQRFLTGL